MSSMREVDGPQMLLSGRGLTAAINAALRFLCSCRRMARAENTAAPMRWPISRKLALLIVAAVMTGLFVVTLTAVWQETTRYADARRDALLSAARVIAAATGSAMAANDEGRARQVLTVIGQTSNIDYAGVSLNDGRI